MYGSGVSYNPISKFTTKCADVDWNVMLSTIGKTVLINGSVSNVITPVAGKLHVGYHGTLVGLQL